MKLILFLLIILIIVNKVIAIGIGVSPETLVLNKKNNYIIIFNPNNQENYYDIKFNHEDIIVSEPQGIIQPNSRKRIEIKPKTEKSFSGNLYVSLKSKNENGFILTPGIRVDISHNSKHKNQNYKIDNLSFDKKKQTFGFSIIAGIVIIGLISYLGYNHIIKH
jgi:hypothetical protein